MTFIGCSKHYLSGNSCLAPTGITRTPLFTVGSGRFVNQVHDRMRDSRQPALEGLTRSPRTDSPPKIGRNKFRRSGYCGGGGDKAFGGGEAAPIRARYGPFNPYIPIRSTTIGKSRVAKDPIALHTSCRSNSDITSVTSIGYPRMSASGESSTTMHRLLHASGSHPIPPPDDPKEHCDVLSMQMDSDLVIYRTTLVRTFQVVTICRVDKSEVLVVLMSPHDSKYTRSVLGKWVYLVTLVMSLFDLQDVCITIGSLATIDLPMVVDLIGIYVLKGPYCTLTTTNWFLQALSVISRGSWGDVARRFTMIRWTSPKLFRSRNGCGSTASCIPEPLRVTQVLYS
ncbi:hypothetical protein F511_21953 [Dorcoceras hygrometricum]|uniref:Uncharacterized protein n=1 Tax=Dorcoceras hygrometricum TaxID=472368 RepID=A0A2Z7BFS1_9LAMI|nr:hypothetical protein F511_21953 [Dorcoceras hygrometricum]